MAGLSSGPMLAIRAEQVDSFQRDLEAEFEAQMVVHLAEVVPDERGDDSLRPVIRAGIAKARGYGILDAPSVAQLITIMVVVEPEFDERPEYRWAKQVLGDESIEPDARVDIVVELLVERGPSTAGAGK